MTGRRIRVAVVYGGRSSEHGISVVSAGSVIAALDPDRYEVVPIGITRRGGWVLTEADPAKLQIVGGTVPEVDSGVAVMLPGDPTSPELVVLEPGEGARMLESVDVVFPVLHGAYGEDGTVQGLLEMAGVPYVGAGVFASAAAMDKEFAKKLLRAEGLSVARHAVLRRGAPVLRADAEHLGLPLFVKPARAGSSVGISKVKRWLDYPDAVAAAFEHDSKVLVEAAVAGREVECGVLEDERGAPVASVPAEIRLPSGHDWYDFEAKYLDEALQFDLPPELPAPVLEAVRDAACRAFTAVDCAGLARVDFFVTREDEVVVNELNTMPGFTPMSVFPRVWSASGVGYAELVDRLIASALRRAGR